MPRPTRSFISNGIYHILNRGNGRQRVFQKDGDYLVFLKLLGEMKEQYGIELYAYCLMPNHFHLLVKAPQGEELSPAMQWFLANMSGAITSTTEAAAISGKVDSRALRFR